MSSEKYVKIRFADKDRFEQDRAFCISALKELESSKRDDRLTLTFVATFIFFYILHELEVELFIYLLDTLVGLSVFLFLILIILYIPQKRNAEKKRNIIEENFTRNWGVKLSNLNSTRKEFTFEDSDKIPWEYVEKKVLFRDVKNEKKIEIFISPIDRCIIVKIDFGHNATNEGVEVRYHINDSGITQGNLIKLIESFKFSVIEDLIPERISLKITTIFPDCRSFSNQTKQPLENSDVIDNNRKKFSEESILVFKDTISLEKRWVYLERLQTGNWRIHEVNMGPLGEKMFGREENEWWINIEDSESLKVFSVIFENSFSTAQDKPPLSLSSLKDMLTSREIKFEGGVW